MSPPPKRCATTEAVATTEAPATTEAVATTEVGAATSVPTATSEPAAAVGVGPECADLSAVGDGALPALADVPAGTAISNSQETSTLQQWLGDAELLEGLDGEGPFTVFAPRNSAFVDVPADVRAQITADPELLASSALVPRHRG